MTEPRTGKFGRAPRRHDPAVPHLSKIAAGLVQTPPPDEIDWTKGLPDDLGTMLNDKLGCCTCAAFYHALQIWSGNTGTMLNPADADVAALYSEVFGYDPSKPGNGPGGDAQTLLTHVLKQGAPLGGERVRIAAFVEVNPTDLDDVKRAIRDCGVTYIGFNVPRNFLDADGEAPPVWQLDPHLQPIIGSHAVILAGYGADGAKVISWGRHYTMSWPFFGRYVDEAYAIADHSWLGAKKTTPGGLSLAALEAEMRVLHAAGVRPAVTA
ncbi:MAG TPA: hypothetical protein VM689_17870 [Aliidongia sp.]|nr:hypothetical protein [Aliidongia sp.]